ncbi:hypothetical protein [Fusobacterium pseudoperiodonticum]|uniref:hypothetical protein n=1 Tax=Fusobacterium pseudoperiodonticum TaxID=2663009 RepID=UPI0028D37B31|nr:hypothetical protein [Fusobacterium pseudoperiodonticum]
MKLKVKQSLIYCGIVYNPGEVVDILESDIIERVKSLELVEAEEVVETENLVETAETEEVIETENLEEATEENTEVEEATKNSKKSKKA